MRYASGQSASTATPLNPFSSIRCCVMRARSIELVRAVRGFADHHDARVADVLRQPVVIVRAVRQTDGMALDRADRIVAFKRAGEQPSHFFVGSLIEPLVPETDRA